MSKLKYNLMVKLASYVCVDIEQGSNKLAID